MVQLFHRITVDKLVVNVLFQELCLYAGRRVVSLQVFHMAPSIAKRDPNNEEANRLGRKAFNGQTILKRCAILCRTEVGAKVSGENSKK